MRKYIVLAAILFTATACGDTWGQRAVTGGGIGAAIAQTLGEAGARLVRMKCGEADVVLFQRPRPLKRTTLQEDGIAHQAFEVRPETFDEAVAFLKSQGCYHEGPVARASGRAVYFFDSEGNYQQLHASR